MLYLKGGSIVKYPYKPKVDFMGEERDYAIFIPILLPKYTSHLPLSAPHLLFEVRSSTLRHQPSEICFPGGKIEQGETPEIAAIRETSEELLLNPRQIELLTPSNLIVTPQNRVLYPYLGFLHEYEGTYSKDEVAETFLVPLSYFETTKPTIYYNQVTISAPSNFPLSKMPNKTSYRFENGKYPVPFYEYQNRTIWGITARIIQAMLPRLEVLKYELY